MRKPIDGEQEIWSRLPELMEDMFEAYAMAYPGLRLSSAPIVRALSLQEYIDAIREQDPLGLAPSEEIARTYMASALPDGTVIVNKDHNMVRQTIGAGLFTNVLSQYPAVFLEEIFHTDRTALPLATPFTIQTSDQSYTFNQVNGFGLEQSDSGWKFAIIEEAGSVLASLRVQQLLGVNPNLPSNSYNGIANLMLGLMNNVGLEIEDMVAFHQQSDLDGFLREIYPSVTDLNGRRLQAVVDFQKIFNQGTLPAEPQLCRGDNYATKAGI